MRIARQMVMPPHREGCQLQYAELPTSGPVADSLAPLLEWLAGRLDQPVSVAEMAVRSQVSARTLTRRFTEQLGISPGRWLLDRRIAATRALLEETDLPVETIAHRVGLLGRQPAQALPRSPAHHTRRLPARLPRGQGRIGRSWAETRHSQPKGCPTFHAWV